MMELKSTRPAVVRIHLPTTSPSSFSARALQNHTGVWNVHLLQRDGRLDLPERRDTRGAPS